MTALAYCWPQSVASGADVDLFLSGDGSTELRIEVVRDGVAPAPIWSVDGVVAPSQAIPEDAPEEGCGWASTMRIPIGAWPSGVYLVRTSAHGGEGVHPPSAWFVVRPERCRWHASDD